MSFFFGVLTGAVNVFEKNRKCYRVVPIAIIKCSIAYGLSKKFSRFVGLINCTRSEIAIELNLCPNPANDEVKFAHGGVVPEQLDIYDALGREVYSGVWLSDWNVETLEAGIYFVRATSQGDSVVKRLEIAR